MHRTLHSGQNRAFRFVPLVVLLAAPFAPAVQAASFVIADGETVTTKQRLYDNETGEIQIGGRLSTSATSGIQASGANATVSNGGLITTIGDGKAGIISSGANATVTSSGTISFATTTSAGGGYGIYSTGANAIVTNSGTISIKGYNALGIYSTGANTILTNNGSISTTGDSAFGIDSNGANTVLTNSGSITTTGASAYGINSSGAYTTLTNSGSISTTGDWAYGIYSSNGATLTNSGSISTTGTQAHGIVSDDAALTNSGSISTTGNSAYGIYATGAAITNSGSISTTGDNGYGIYSTGNSVVLTHSGSITVTGANAVGLYVIGTGNNLINVTGSVVATGSATQAIVGGGGNETLNLLPGARIIGSINLGAGTDGVNVISSGAGSSATMTIDDVEAINTISGNALTFVNAGTNTVYFADTTNLTATQASLGTLSSSIFRIVNQQLNSPPAMYRPVKVASTGSLAGLWSDDSAPKGWGQVFGKHVEQGSSGAALSFNDYTYGVIGGYEQRLGDHRAGVFGGVSQADIDTDSASASTNSNGLFAGVYGQYAKESWLFNGVLALGYANYDGERRVTDNQYGNETASADYDGWYVSPSVAITRIFDLGAGFSLRPSGEVNYTYGRLGSYDESGTTRSNLSVDSRTAQVLNTRLQLAARQELADKQGELEWRGGLSHTRYGDDSAAITLQGVGSTRYSLTGTGNVTGAYVGVGGRVYWNKSLDFVGDAEYFHSDDNDRSVMAYAGLEYRF